jgi:nucleotide-binding universal stress UspA family protein
MPTYIVASDLSERSDRALQRAFLLASGNGARLVILSAVDDGLPDDIAARMKTDAEAQLKRTATALAVAQPVEWDVQVVTGDPITAIAETVARLAPDLLILGQHRLRPFLDDFRDTTMQLLVRMGLCPTLLVRDPAYQPYRTALAAIDFSPASAEAIRVAKAIAPDAAIEGVHAVHIPFRGLIGDQAGGSASFLAEARREAAAWGNAQGLTEVASACTISPGGVHEVVAAAVRARRPDMMVLGAHSRGKITAMVLGSYVAELIRDPGTDLLVAQPVRA